MTRHRSGPMAAYAAVVGLLAGLSAALGVFARGDGSFTTVTSVRGVTYEMATSGVYANNAQRIVAEGIGWDMFTLFAVVPALLVAATLVARGSFRGRLVVLGLLGYLFYQYLEYAVTWAFGPLFPLFITIYSAALGGMVWIGVSLTREGIGERFDARFPGRAFAVVNVGLAGLLALSWTRVVAIGLGGDLEAAGLRGETTLVVQALDLGLVIPAAVFISVLAWRRSPAGYLMAVVFSVLGVAMASAIGTMLISAWQVEGTLEMAPLAMFMGYAALAMIVAVRMLRSARPSTSKVVSSALVAAQG